eukprot:m51a1_g1884 putative tpa: ring zinc finger domain superfamily protein (273) ;mRNA; r:710816-711753
MSAASDDDGSGSDVCPVCLTELRTGHAARARGCGHAFCEQCIARWLRTSASCPLCKAATASYLVGGCEVAVQLQQRPAGAADEEEDLSCLDEIFFLGEIPRLLARARETLSRAAARGDVAGTRAMTAVVRELSEDLDSMRAAATGSTCVPVDARSVLLRMYALQDTVEEIRGGGVSPAAAESEPSRLYGADDADQVPEDDDYDYAEASQPSPSRRGRRARRAASTAATGSAAAPVSPKSRGGKHRQQDPEPFGAAAGAATSPRSAAKLRQRH